jgi:hypothetical protein
MSNKTLKKKLILFSLWYSKGVITFNCETNIIIIRFWYTGIRGHVNWCFVVYVCLIMVHSQILKHELYLLSNLNLGYMCYIYLHSSICISHYIMFTMICLYVLGFTSHRHSICHIATFLLYWWRKTSGALPYIISGTNGYLSRTTDVP